MSSGVLGGCGGCWAGTHGTALELSSSRTLQRYLGQDGRNVGCCLKRGDFRVDDGREERKATKAGHGELDVSYHHPDCRKGACRWNLHKSFRNRSESLCRGELAAHPAPPACADAWTGRRCFAGSLS